MAGQTGADIGSVLSPVSAGLGILEGGIQLFSNLSKEKRDEAALKNLTQPFYKIQDEFLQNKNLASEQAQGGLPTATKDYLTGESGRGLSAGISGTLQGGGNINDINKLFDTYNKSIDRTAAEDADIHRKNIDYFMGINKDLAGERIKQWSLNEYQPYEEKKKQLSENIASEKANVFGGANTAIGSMGALGTSLENNGLLKQLFKADNNTLQGPSVFGAGSFVPSISDENKTTTSNRPMVNSTSYIDPFVPSPIPNYSNPFQLPR